MSVLISFENCSLISHEHFVNRVYDEVITKEGEQFTYKISPDLFELNVPYRYKTNEAQTKKRQRKIIKKTNDVVATDHREEYELVLFTPPCV